MTALAIAELIELESDFVTPKTDNARRATVQFNPETLKVSYSNQLAGNDKDSSGKSTDGAAAKQLVGQGSTKLALQLWFDITAPLPAGQPAVNDVRRLTGAVVQLMNPGPRDEAAKFLAPAVGFRWGSFWFAGVIDALEETLEYFSADGIPLRASMTLAMSQQTILVPAPPAGGRGFSRPAVGARPLAQAAGGSSVQSVAAASGKAGDWQRIAAANGIENPRRLAPGQLLDLNGGA